MGHAPDDFAINGKAVFNEWQRITTHGVAHMFYLNSDATLCGRNGYGFPRLGADVCKRCNAIAKLADLTT